MDSVQKRVADGFQSPISIRFCSFFWNSTTLQTLQSQPKHRTTDTRMSNKSVLNQKKAMLR